MEPDEVEKLTIVHDSVMSGSMHVCKNCAMWDCTRGRVKLFNGVIGECHKEAPAFEQRGTNIGQWPLVFWDTWCPCHQTKD